MAITDRSLEGNPTNLRATEGSLAIRVLEHTISPFPDPGEQRARLYRSGHSKLYMKLHYRGPVFRRFAK